MTPLQEQRVSSSFCRSVLGGDKAASPATIYCKLWVPASSIARCSTLFKSIYLVCGMTWVNPAMETAGLSNVPSERLGNDGDGVNLKGSDPPGAMSPDIVG
jgi:hypothetical protein